MMEGAEMERLGALRQVQQQTGLDGALGEVQEQVGPDAPERSGDAGTIQNKGRRMEDITCR